MFGSTGGRKPRNDIDTMSGDVQRRRRLKPAAIAGIVAGGIVVLLLIAALIFALIIHNLDTIYPGLTIDGTDVSGLTENEAINAMGEYGKTGISAEVSLPSGEIITVTAENAGIPSTPQELAKMAMEYGRDGNFISNALTYLKKPAGKTDILDEVFESIDESAVKQTVSQVVSAYNEIAGKKAYEISDTQITIVKGGGQGLADEAAVEALVLETLKTSIESGKPASADYTFDMGAETDIDAIYNEIYIEPVSAKYDKETGGVTASVTGVSFDLEAAKAAYDAAKMGDVINVEIIKTEPALTAANADELLFRDMLYNCKTTLSGSSSNRVTNIRLAAEAINGTVLNPGDEFSFNNVVGERTSAKGYKTGTSYIGGQAVPDIGGGICQVSSSLYCCAIYNNLEIVSRANHMFVVNYLPLGIDATVSWGTCDFVFKNTMDYPIKIEAYTSGSSSLVVNFYGTKVDDTYIEITSQVVGVRNYDVIEKESSSVPAGTTQVETGGRTGYVVDLYRSFYSGDGTLINTEYLARSDYSKQDRVILVPVKTSAPAETQTTPSDSGDSTDSTESTGE